MAKNRKEEIIKITTEILQTKGYSAFSYQDLSDRLGITKASIHHHFPGKKDLAVEVAKKYRVSSKQFLQKQKGKQSDPRDQLQSYFDMVLKSCESGDKICAACSIQAEYNVVPKEVSQEIEQMNDHTISWIAETLNEGRKQGKISFVGKPEVQAALIFCACQGAMQQARATEIGKFHEVIGQIKATLKPRM